MTGSGGGLRACGSLVLLGLCVWTGARAADPKPVSKLRVQKQTNTSISLGWDAPQGSHPNSTYWVQWAGQGDRNETQSTKDTTYTATGLEPESWYDFSVWVEEGGVHSSPENLSAATAPNSVRDLSVTTQTNSSIHLRWEVPDGPHPLNYTYWVRWPGPGDKTESRNTTEASFTVDALRPASSYELSVWAEKNGVPSSTETVTGHTAPNSVRDLSVTTQANSSIGLSWEVPDGPEPLNYTYWVQWTRGSNGTKTQSTADTRSTVKGLEPGTLYQVSVWVEKNGVASSRQNRSVSTAPNSVRDLSVTTQTNSSIHLRWEVPDGPDPPNYTYWVQWTRGSDGTKTQSTVDTRSTVKGLEPGTLYQVSVWAEKNGVASSRQNRSVSTAPNSVRDLRMVTQTNSSIHLRWEVPDGPEPPNYTYWVRWPGPGDKTESRNTTEASFTVDALRPASSYELSVWAEKNGVPSSTETVTGHTAPNSVRDLSVTTQTNSSIGLSWEVPDGPEPLNYTYWVQWTGSNGTKTQSTADTRSTVKGLEPGTLYQVSVWAEKNGVASSRQNRSVSTDPDPVIITSCVSTSGGYGIILTWSCPLGGYEAFELQVGGQLRSQDRASCGRGVSVTGLQPAQSYSATITTLWEELRAPPAFITCHTESAGVIIGAIVGVLLFLILVGLLIFFLKKRYKKTQENSALSFPEDIAAADFADHVRRNEKDSNCGFAEEYQRLALEGHGQSQMVASAPENSAKNRYRNVLPYDWSRVVLKTVGEEPGSDYINASFIPGLWSSQEFIATQGPLPQTVGDFWRLVWEQQSQTLVMLTNCVEHGRVKCEHYWPLDAQPCTHGHLRVTLEGEELKKNWTVRDLRLRHTQEQKTLCVRQFHYVAWPDHGVPYSPDPLLAFWKMVRQWLDQTPGGGPPIVHCSAGVGRTGTIIALDVLLRQLECEGVVGPFNFVKKMRESRPLMVQTEAQYVFLHHCILQFLKQPFPVQAKKEATYENLVFENEADDIQDHYRI